MARRGDSWDEFLSEQLKDLNFAQQYLLALVQEEGLSYKDALRETIEGYGYREYAKLCKIEETVLHRALRNESNITISTLKKILTPLGLGITLKLESSGEAA